MPRPQFRLSTLLWITLAVACWFGGAAIQRRIDIREIHDREIERLEKAGFFTGGRLDP